MWYWVGRDALPALALFLKLSPGYLELSVPVALSEDVGVTVGAFAD